MSEIHNGDTGFSYIVKKLVEYGHAHCLSDYLDGYAEALCPDYSGGWTLRHLAVEEAAKEGQLDCLKLLLSDYAFAESLCPGIISERSMRQHAFITALEYGKAACLISLLKEGGLGDILFPEDDLAPTWHHYAVLTSIRKKNKECLVTLLNHPDFKQLNWPNKLEGWTIFHLVLFICTKEGGYNLLKAVLGIEGVSQLPVVGFSSEPNMLHYVIENAVRNKNIQLIHSISQDKDFDQLHLPGWGIGGARGVLLFQIIKNGNATMLADFLKQADLIGSEWLQRIDNDRGESLLHAAVIKAIDWEKIDSLKRILDYKDFKHTQWVGMESGWTIRHYAFLRLLEKGHL